MGGELSLEEQFKSTDAFFESLRDIITIQNLMELCSVRILKHQELYNFKVTKDYTLYQILIDKKIRTTHELRKFKIHLKMLMSDPPFWHDDQKHNPIDRYLCEYTDMTHGYSLAEACERNKLVLSFNNQKFKDGTLDISKNGTLVNLINIIEPRSFADFLQEEGLISVQDYCINRFEGLNISFSKLEADYDFSILEGEEVYAFISTFKKFSEMQWDEIMQSDGLEYKKYQPPSKKSRLVC